MINFDLPYGFFWLVGIFVIGMGLSLSFDQVWIAEITLALLLLVGSMTISAIMRR